ncbi:Fimbrial protein [Gammaproteobacteria bacterium]|nr:Fimbrial protein [Gammaproteobacteria bacterium]
MDKRGFTLIELLIVVVIVGILALAAIPLIQTNLDEARSAEARAAMGALKDRARVVYQRNPSATLDKASLGLGSTELNGSYFTDANYTVTSTSPTNWQVQCDGVFSSAPTDLTVTANIVSGSATFNR